MKDIKEVRQALETIKDYTRTDNAYVVTITGESIKTLDQFITEVEELIKESEKENGTIGN